MPNLNDCTIFPVLSGVTAVFGDQDIYEDALATSAGQPPPPQQVTTPLPFLSALVLYGLCKSYFIDYNIMIFQPTLKKSTIETFLKELKGGIQDH